MAPMNGLLVLWMAIGLHKAVAQFYLYPPIDPNYLASALNLTTDCLSTLNTTLPACDPTLTSMVGSVDDFFWTADNVTALCASSNCSSQIVDWEFAAAYDCYGQTLNVGGKLVPADTVPGRYLDGINLACLIDYDESPESYGWCLTQSLNWTGSDIVRPDCSVTPSDPQCQNPSNVDAGNQRLANLYSDDILCSSCFFQMLQARVTSPFLPDTDYSDFLVDQLQDIVDVCNNTAMPNISTRQPFGYVPAPTPTSQAFGNGTSTSTSTSVTAAATCTGQVVSGSASKRAADIVNVHHRPQDAEDLGKRQSSACNTLSQKYGVTTGDLQTLTGSDSCTISGSICLPAKCTLQQVGSGATCDSLAAGITNGNITTLMFQTWNPNIQGLCDSVTAGQYVCVSAPGGTYQVAPPPLGTSADAGNQQRGGQGGVVTPTTTVTTTGNSVSEAPGPTATQSGIAAGCNNYAQAKAGDDCYDFANSHGITPAQLYQYNSILGPNGANCSLMFQAQEYYCIGVASGTTTPTTTTSSSTSHITAPGPTQSGITNRCTQFVAAKSGDDCYDFAQAHNIGLSELAYWNPVLGVNGASCSTNFQAGEYYCVAVSGSTAVPTAPGPVQSGIAANCNKWVAAKSGDDCYDFAVAQGIPQASLYSWNPALGANGAQCSTMFQAGEYYCVGVDP